FPTRSRLMAALCTRSLIGLASGSYLRVAQAVGLGLEPGAGTGIGVKRTWPSPSHATNGCCVPSRRAPMTFADATPPTGATQTTPGRSHGREPIRMPTKSRADGVLAYCTKTHPRIRPQDAIEIAAA